MLNPLFLHSGNIDIMIGDDIDSVDDFDNIIPYHYFTKILELSGDLVDSNGSEMELNSLDEDDNIDITVTSYHNYFEIDDGNIVSFDELEVRCTGKIIQTYAFGDPTDVIRVDSYTVIGVR